MLALTKKTDYALIALSHMAPRSEDVLSAREIAEASGLPLPILTNVLKTLAGAGVVFSTRGASGGYGLAKPLENISLYELLISIEGPFQFVQCALAEVESNKAACDLEPSCPIRRPVFRIHDRLRDFLQSVSLAEIVGDTGEAQLRQDIVTESVE